MIKSIAQDLCDAREIPTFTVSDLALSLKRTVEDKYAHVRVRGEISGLKKHTSGHTYFALKDENAVIDAVAWRGSCQKGPVALTEGLEIVAIGRLTTFPARSKYQFIVEGFEATGQGALLKLLEERKKYLAAEGLFSSERKKSLPPFPQVIGVITSPTGAVIRDILHRIADRYPCHVILWPVPVQGIDAAEKIAFAIEGFNRIPQKPDVLIVARGGGSLEDLWAFNEEVVVRAAAKSTIPLISAIGHETDTTLIDYASDLRAPTPTGAAEMAVPVLMNLWTHLEDRGRRSQDLINRILHHSYLTLSVLEKGIPAPQRLLDDGNLKLDHTGERLYKALPQYYQVLTHHLEMLRARLKSPATLLESAEERLSFLGTRLEQASFHKVLERGFCLARTPEGHPISSASSFPAHTPVTLLFKDGGVNVVKSSPTRPEPVAKKKRKLEEKGHQLRLF